MFNLNDDPMEMHNLAHHHGKQEIREKLQQRLIAKLTEVGDPFEVRLG